MKKIRTILTVLVLMLFAAGVTFVVTYSTMNNYYDGQGRAVSKKTSELYAILDRCYIGDMDPQYVSDEACRAIVDAIGDEWSYYISADEYAAYLERLNNQYVGIGITIQLDEESGGFEVIEVAKNGPAAEAGVQPQDIICAVNGVNVLGQDMNEVREMVRGEENTTVEITFLRGQEEVTFTITRRSIETEIVRYQLLDSGDGYLKINNFDSNASQRSIEAIQELQKMGAKSIIFDVRFNPGGLKAELVDLLDYLLPECEVFHTLDYRGEDERSYSDADYLDMPMAVLVNVDSYSAAEFFAAALQEYEAATIVGVQTYGKGRFQQALRMSDGSAVNLSIGQYFTPSGKDLTGVGITPDYVVELDDDDLRALASDELAIEEDAQLQQAIAALAP